MPRQTGGQDELSKGLSAARLAAGLSTTRQAASRTGKTQSMISRVESGATIPSPELVEELCGAYGTPRRQTDRLTAMAEDVRAGTRPLVLSRRTGTRAAQARIGRVHAQSARIRGFTIVGLPGMLQTEAYALGVMSARHGQTPQAEAAAKQRIENQRLLDEADSPRHWHYIITEGSLSWAFGDGETMAAQMRHLSAATYRRNLQLGVVPFGAWHPRLRTPLNGAEIYDARLVQAGTISAVMNLEHPSDVAAYADVFDKLHDLAKYDDDARQILANAIERYESL
jgi:transcriptional regulator with XRE-family HTH domain